MARVGGGGTGGVPGTGTAAGPWWRNPVANVWVVFAVSLLSFAPDISGPIDLTVAGHVMAGERFLFVPALAAWSLAIWWGGRRSHVETAFAKTALCAAAMALLTAPMSFEWGSLPWLLHQLWVGALQLLVCMQLLAWFSAARMERGGVLTMLCGATLELLIFLAVQSGGWNAACDAGLGLTCIEGPWVTNAPAALELLGLICWTSWLIRRLDRGGA